MNKFRTKTNRLITKDLFLEVSDQAELVLYSLGREHLDVPSLYKLYMAEEDFTEFEFATKYFESFQHWKRLCEMNFFIPYISEWKEELELKIRARFLKNLIGKGENDANVAKYLLNGKWIEDAQKSNQVTNLRGRPSKQEIRNHLTLISSQEKQIEEDYKRIIG